MNKYILAAGIMFVGLFGLRPAANNDDVPHVTSANWKAEVENSTEPVLVDFYASWCKPCRQSAPHVKQAMKDYKGKLKVVKVDIDAEPGLMNTYGVTSIPTFVIFKNGKEVSRTVGGVDLPTLKAFIDKAIKP